MVNIMKEVGRLNAKGKILKGSGKKDGLRKYIECKIKRLDNLCK